MNPDIMKMKYLMKKIISLCNKDRHISKFDIKMPIDRKQVACLFKLSHEGLREKNMKDIELNTQN